MKINRKKGYFSISAVAKMFSIHQQTIRLYEKEGLIAPKRSEGNTRLFSEEDVDRLEEIIHLTHELGINLAGVEMIFKLKKQIAKMQKDMNRVFEDAQQELDKETEHSKTVIKSSAQQLLKLKQEKKQSTKPSKPSTEIQPVTTKSPTPSEPIDIDMDDWEIEYEE
jgi:MerR family transcriptional regulator/heat shock protein HspR